MNIKTKEIGDIVIVYLSGKLDSTISRIAEEELNEIINKKLESNFLLNFEEVNTMSSNGIRIIANAKNTLNKKNKVIKLCCLRNTVKRIAEVIELSSLIDIYESEDEALQSFSA